MMRTMFHGDLQKQITIAVSTVNPMVCVSQLPFFRVGEGMLHYSFAQNGIMDQFKIITISKRVQEHRFDPQGQQGYALGFIDVLGVLLHAVYGGNKYFRIVFVPNFPFKIRSFCSWHIMGYIFQALHSSQSTMHVAQLHIIEDREEARVLRLTAKSIKRSSIKWKQDVEYRGKPHFIILELGMATNI
ncbi:hypothetical protein IFM89_001776 [Coptis chinensis]|uniref:Uncharacterized protein n=1 Tax=Coptis chinensis TaxID=261450 RepID=A0A835LLY4_9MAGN|nr:hypothetical protein IFM89_001776 [Coptis chinensis]